ncbi:MAG: hypothetical protein ACE5HU_01270, partial [Acidobacteriota bacterium]
MTDSSPPSTEARGGTTDRPSRDAYFRSIEKRFLRLRGEPLLLSPADWHLAEAWWREQIPLPVVLRALDTVFARAAARGRPSVHSLAYCRHAVDAEFNRHRELSIGGHGSSPEAAPGTANAAEHLQKKLHRLDALRRASDGDIREVLTRAMADLQDALGELSTGSRTPSQVEESLLDIEARVIDALLDGLDPDERHALDETCDRRLARYGKDMTPAVRAL